MIYKVTITYKLKSLRSCNATITFGTLYQKLKPTRITKTQNSLVTCFSSSSRTSSNNSFEVEPEVFDATAKYAGKSLI